MTLPTLSKMAFRSAFRLAPLRSIRHYSKNEANEIGKEETKAINDEESKVWESFSKCGDDGTSKTITGEVLPKNHSIFNAIGATEELLSYLGLAREYAYENEHDYTDKLKRIQTIVIDISTAISRTTGKNGVKQMPKIYTQELEDWIQEYSKELAPLEQYIIPGGGMPSASLHIARSVCRKTERKVIPFVQEGSLDGETLRYLNRLSDFLLTVSRIAAKRDQRTESIYIPTPDETVQPQ